MSRRTCSLISQIAASVARSRASGTFTASKNAMMLMNAFETCPSQFIRSFQTSMRIQTSNLLAVLDEEIKHENESYEKPAEIASGPPAPFTLLENGDGDTLLTLVRERGITRNSETHHHLSTLYREFVI